MTTERSAKAAPACTGAGQRWPGAGHRRHRHRAGGGEHDRHRRVHQPRLPGAGTCRRASPSSCCGWSAASSRCAAGSPMPSWRRRSPAPAGSTTCCRASTTRRSGSSPAGCRRRWGSRRRRRSPPWPSAAISPAPGPGAPELAVALAVVWAVTLVHLCGTEGASAFQNVSTLFKVALIVGFIVAAVAYGQPQPLSFAPSSGDLGPDREPAVRGRPRLRHVLLRRLERRDLHRRRGARPQAHRAAVGRRRRRRGDAALRRPQRGVPLHHPHRPAGGPDPGGRHRRPAHLRRNRRAYRRCGDLRRPHLLHQRHDVARARASP